MTKPEVVGSVLFAAGRGVRLRPLTDVIPKSALPMLDLPLGTWALRSLTAAAAPTIVNVSHLGEAVRAALEPHAPPGSVGVLVERPEPFGSAGTLAALRGRLGARVVTCNSDLLSDLDAADLITAHEHLGAPATIAVARVDAGADFVVSEHAASALIDRRRDAGAPGGVFLGMAVFERATVDLITDERPLDLTRGLLAPLVERGELAVHAHSGYAADVGTLESYLAASLDLLAGRGPRTSARFPGKIVVVGGGLAYIGSGVDVHVESLRPGAILLAGSTVADGATVSRSIVFPHEVVRPGAIVKGSIWINGAALRVTRTRHPPQEPA